MSGKKFYVRLFAYILISIFGIVILLLVGSTVIDLLYPQKGIRFHYWNLLKLPTNSTIVKLIEPKTTDLNAWKPDTLYWYFKDQETMNPNKGYICGIEGKINRLLLNYVWYVKTDKGQVFTLYLSGNPQLYILQPVYSDKDGTWIEKKVIADSKQFQVNSWVRVIWDCPLANPEEMVNNGIVKDDYLKISPGQISTKLQ